MPVTPFHFGPGFLIKSVFVGRFSFRIFVLSNIIIDLEPLYFILTNQWPLHRFFHTYLGATVIAMGCVMVGRPICYQLTNIWNMILKNVPINSEKISTSALVMSAFIGTYSHVFLDSIMHRDLRPFAPWANSNGLLHIVSYGQLHLFCFLAGVVGIAIYRKNVRAAQFKWENTKYQAPFRGHTELWLKRKKW